mgnify:CR=1 FL=1
MRPAFGRATFVNVDFANSVIKHSRIGILALEIELEILLYSKKLAQEVLRIKIARLMRQLK